MLCDFDHQCSNPCPPADPFMQHGQSNTPLVQSRSMETVAIGGPTTWRLEHCQAVRAQCCQLSESRLCVNLTRRCAYCLDHREIAKRLSQMLLECPGVSLLISKLLVFPCRNDLRVMEGRGAGRRRTEAIRKTTWKLEQWQTVGA